MWELNEALNYLVKHGAKPKFQKVDSTRDTLWIGRNDYLIWIEGSLFHLDGETLKYTDISWVRNPFSPDAEERFLLGEVNLRFPDNSLIYILNSTQKTFRVIVNMTAGIYRV